MGDLNLGWLGPAVAVFGLLGVLLYIAMRRAYAIRNQALTLTVQHDRLLIYAQARIGAQKAQALAAHATTAAAQAEHLREAVRFWRQASQNRPTDDADELKHILAQIAMLEEDLDALEPDEDGSQES